MSDIASTRFAAPTDPAAQKLDLGAVWRLTLGTFRQAPWTFIGLALLPPLLSVAAALPPIFLGRHGDAGIASAGLRLILTLVQYVIQIITQLAAIYGAAHILGGASFSLGEALRVGARRFWPVLGMGIMLGLLILLGLVLLIVPGIIAICVFAVAAQACVVEGLGPIESMKRSAFLTKGNRWRLIGAYFLVLFLPSIAALLVVMIVALVAGFALAQLHLQIAAVILVALLLIPTFLVILAMTNVLLAVLFVELRRLKEGGDPRGEVAQVFD